MAGENQDLPRSSTTSLTDPFLQRPDVVGSGPKTTPCANTGVASRAGLSIDTRKQHQRNEFSMPCRFYRRQCISYLSENTPWVKTWNQGNDLSELDMTFFVWTDLDSPSDKHRIDTIRDILHDTGLKDLINRDENAKLAKKALLIDGNNFGMHQDEPKLRPFHGALTAKQLFEELLEPRYQADPSGPEIVNAERRLIYLTDLDAPALLALVLSAPESLGRLLGDYILAHLTSRVSIGITFATDGPETFSMEFSVPFRVLRSTKELIIDPRLKQSSGKPLRSSLDVTSLLDPDRPGHDSEGVDGIYSAHLSCIVTGYDQWRWTGIVLVDTWFENPTGKADCEPPSDSVLRYEVENSMCCGIRMDPLSRGKDDAKRSKWHPRPYFLRIVEIRLGQVRREWEEIIHNLIRAVDKYTHTTNSVCKQVSNGSRGLCCLGCQEKSSSEVALKLTGVVGIICELSSDLREVNRSGENFLNYDSRYFLCGPDATGSMDEEDCVPHLRQVRKQFAELCLLSERLDDIENNCRAQLSEMEKKTEEHQRLPEIGSGPTDAILHRIFWAIVVFGVLNTGLIGFETLQILFSMISIPLAALLFAYGMKYPSHGFQQSAASPSNFCHPFSWSWSRKLADAAFLRMNVALGNQPVATDMTKNGKRPCNDSPPARFNLRHIQRVRYLNKGDGPYNTYLDDGHGATELIPICVRQETIQSSNVPEAAFDRCHDDKTFFVALKNIVSRNPWTWSGALRSLGLKRVVAVHYVKYKLRQDGSVIIVARGQFPSSSEAGIYRPTAGTFNPISPYCFTATYEQRSELMSGVCQILDNVVHKIDHSTRASGLSHAGYALELEEGLDGRLLAITRLALVVISFTTGVSWGAVTGDVQSGLSVANVLMITGLVFVTAIHSIEASYSSV